MPVESKVMEVYFDEAGYTGENVDDLSQSNLLLAAVAIPAEVAEIFWRRAARAWKIAATCLEVPLTAVELKGADIYGGKGQFSDVAGSTRMEVLEAVFETLTELQIQVYWDGLPKHEWKHVLHSQGKTPEQFPFWKHVLLGFCSGLYQLLSALYPNDPIHLAGDENSWVGAGKMLAMRDSDRWCQLTSGGIEFHRSSEVHGIQIADVVVHTLYRTNRDHLPRPGTKPPKLSHTDLKAKEFHARLAEKGLWTNVSTTLSRVK
jgi:hypothetical protein